MRRVPILATMAIVLFAVPIAGQPLQSEDLGIQQRLALFTGLLVLVGALQVGAMVWQACVFLRTLRAVNRQALEMKHQRIVMVSQFETMQKQFAEMERQRGILDKSVKVAERSADAAYTSTQIIINKERARIGVQVKPLSLHPLFSSSPTIQYSVVFYGTTPGFIRTNFAIGYVSDSDAPATEGLRFAVTIPEVMTPNIAAKECQIFLQPNMKVEPDVIAAIKTRKKFVHFWGIIEYADVFGLARETRFRYIWTVTDIMNFDGTNFAYWNTHGSPDDNRET
jgi:hypothetical protein